MIILALCSFGLCIAQEDVRALSVDYNDVASVQNAYLRVLMNSYSSIYLGNPPVGVPSNDPAMAAYNKRLLAKRTIAKKIELATDHYIQLLSAEYEAGALNGVDMAKDVSDKLSFLARAKKAVLVLDDARAIYQDLLALHAGTSRLKKTQAELAGVYAVEGDYVQEMTLLKESVEHHTHLRVSDMSQIKGDLNTLRRIATCYFKMYLEDQVSITEAVDAYEKLFLLLMDHGYAGPSYEATYSIYAKLANEANLNVVLTHDQLLSLITLSKENPADALTRISDGVSVETLNDLDGPVLLQNMEGAGL